MGQVEVSSSREAFNLEITKIMLDRRKDILNTIRDLCNKANMGSVYYENIAHKLDSLIDMCRYIEIKDMSESQIMADLEKEKNKLKTDNVQPVLANETNKQDTKEGFDLHALD